VAEILAEAFPALYRSTFGRLEEAEIATLLTALYAIGSLSLETTRLAVRDGRVVGLAILHIGRSIGRGDLRAYRTAVRTSLRGWRAFRAFWGGLLANWLLDERIPCAEDLVYVEALAVRSDSRSQGVGTCLLTDAAAWARQAGRTRLALHVLLSNTGARRLYERMGFQPWRRSGHGPLAALFPPARTDWGALLMARSLTSHDT
jgi:GNAT superfamily N-acetyltransferase